MHNGSDKMVMKTANEAQEGGKFKRKRRASGLVAPTDKKRMLVHLNALQNELNKTLARRGLLSFIQQLQPSYMAGWFHVELCERLENFFQDVQRGLSPRLILSVPPRHGKSTVVSKYFPAWCFGKNPDIGIISTSYAATLAGRFSREVQRVIDSELYQKFFPATRLAGKADSYTRTQDFFEIVDAQGNYRAAGVGGGITGMGCDILICDDLVKDAEQAASPIYRQTVNEWFRSVAYTRLTTGGGVIIVMTRWHFDDIAGRLIADAEEGAGDAWEIVSYPAIAESDEPHRKAGEPLHAERFPLEKLESIRRMLGTNQWLSLYQQRPAPVGGGLVKLHWFGRYDDTPETKRIVFSIDTAFKASEISDFTVIQVWAVASAGYFLIDIWRKQAIMPDVIKQIVGMADAYKPHEILIEDAASGQTLIQILKTKTRLPVIAMSVKEKGKLINDKVTRMAGESTVIEAGRVFLPKYARWLQDFEQEIAAFPKAAHDDQVDALSQFLRRMRLSSTNYQYHAVGGGSGFERGGFW